jgi:hypothetical protein
LAATCLCAVAAFFYPEKFVARFLHLCHCSGMTTAKTLKQLIQQEQRGNDERDNDVRCFAINHFGAGDHPYADKQSLPHFKAPYVRECLLKMAAHANIRPEFRQRAEALAQQYDKQKNDKQ